MRTITFADLVKLDSRIGDLLKEAQSVKDVGGESFCANFIWYGRGMENHGLRRKVQMLVGHCRQEGPEELQDSQAYDLVYHTVYDALPDCRNCFLCG